MAFVEARKLAHEIVEAARGGNERAQREKQKRGRRAGPKKQREVREIAALGKSADQVRHVAAHSVRPLPRLRGRVREGERASAPLSTSTRKRGREQSGARCTLQSLQPIPTLERRVADHGALFVQREERRIADAAPQGGAITRERIDLVGIDKDAHVS